MKMPLAAFLLAMPVWGQTADATLPPAGATVVIAALGHGVQVYRCDPQSPGPNAGFKWVPVGPDAVLSDPETKQTVGSHSVGPTWHWMDGSEVQGKVLQTQPSVDAHNIPSLLLAVHSTGAEGVLAKVTLVRRSETQAGTAPELGCRAMFAGDTVRVPYRALYTFYSTAR